MARPLDLAGRTFGDVTVNRLIPDRDKWGGRQWECTCKCGETFTIGAMYLQRGTGVVCNHKLRKHEDIERTSGCKCADHSGFARSTIDYWHNQGALTEGKINGDGKLEDGADFFREMTLDYHKDAMKFYRLISLQRCAKVGRDNRSKKRWKSLKQLEVVFQKGQNRVRRSFVLRELGITKEMLNDWNRRGWPVLDGARPRGGGRYPLDKVMEAKKRLEELPTSIPVDHAEIVSIEMAAKKTGLSVSHLYDKETRQKHGLVTRRFLVRLTFLARPSGAILAKKPKKMIDEVIGITRDSIDAFLKRKAMCQLPEYTTTAPAMAKKCKVAQSTITNWCREGLLDALKSDLWTMKGFKETWIITSEYENDVRDALRATGRDVSATRLKLISLRHERANGNDAPQSCAAQRLVELRASLEAKWKEAANKPATRSHTDSDSRRPAGRRQTPGNRARGKRCAELHSLISKGILKARDAVAIVLGEFGADALGKNAMLDGQKNALRKYAQRYEKACKNGGGQNAGGGGQN